MDDTLTPPSAPSTPYAPSPLTQLPHTHNRQGWTYNIYDGTYSDNASIILTNRLTLPCNINEPNPCYLDGEDARSLFTIDTGLSGWTYIKRLYIKSGSGVMGAGALIGHSSASKVSEMWASKVVI